MTGSFMYQTVKDAETSSSVMMEKNGNCRKGGVEKMAEKHKCHDCKYKGEHQEMKFQPFGVCRKETNLVEAEKAYRAKECPYGVGKKVE